MKEKLCDTCRYRNNVEQLKPCIIYRDNCEYYEKDRGDMTNEQAKAEIMQIYGALSPSKQQALDVALEALEQEPCGDAISRQTVIDSIKRYFHDEYYQRTSIQDCRDCLIEDVIKDIPPVTPQPKTGHCAESENKK